MLNNKQALEKATFAAGCFWGVQDKFDKIRGVKETSVGYAGGHTKNPTYEEVSAGETGHAEAVEMFFDAAEVSYKGLLDVFWNMHDPTTPNRQGPDVGSQYRSMIFYHTKEQREIAEQSKNALIASGKFTAPIVTEIVPAGQFYEAEEYHQKYVAKNGRGACHI